VTGAIRRDAEGDEMRRIVCREFCPPDCCTTSTSSGKEAQDPSQAPPSRWPKLARCPDHLRAGADHRGASCQAALNRRAWARLAGRAVSGAQHHDRAAGHVDRRAAGQHRRPAADTGAWPCACRKPRPGHATRRYSLIRPPARVCRRTRYWSRSTGSGSGFSGAASCRERCGRCWLWWVS
jgi:hypothetical protein